MKAKGSNMTKEYADDVFKVYNDVRRIRKTSLNKIYHDKYHKKNIYYPNKKTNIQWKVL